jgi:hypothetical protein
MVSWRRLNVTIIIALSVMFCLAVFVRNGSDKQGAEWRVQSVVAKYDKEQNGASRHWLTSDNQNGYIPLGTELEATKEDKKNFALGR